MRGGVLSTGRDTSANQRLILRYNLIMAEISITDIYLSDLTTESVPSKAGGDDVLYKVVASSVYILLGVLSIFGNAMVIAVIIRVKSMRTPTNCHLFSLAVVDLLINLLPNLLHSVPEVFGHGTWYGSFGCVLVVYVEYLVFNLTAMSIAAFTAERYIAICHPMKSHYMCTINRAIKIIVCLWVFTAIYCVWWLLLISYEEDRNYQCYYNEVFEHLLPVVYITDCVLFYFIPVGIAIPTYIVIGRALYRSTRSRSSMVASYHRTNRDGTQEKHRERNGASNKQVVKMLFVVVAFFAILWLPYRLVVVLNWVFGMDIHDKWSLFFCRACFYANSAVNPIIYNFMSLNFRRAFRNMCPCLGKLMNNENGAIARTTGRSNTTYTSCATNPHLQGDSVL